MAINGLAGANALKDLCGALSGVDLAMVGIPPKIETRMSVFISMAGQTNERHTTHTTRNDKRFFVNFVYRTDLDAAAAEVALIGIVDSFINAINADLKLGGVCRDIDLNIGLADDPEYMLRWGMEFREYPILVTLKQYGSFSNA